MAWQLVTGLSSQRPSFNLKPVKVEYVMEKVALGQVLLQAHHFSSVSIIQPMPHTHSFICH